MRYYRVSLKIRSSLILILYPKNALELILREMSYIFAEKKLKKNKKVSCPRAKDKNCFKRKLMLLVINVHLFAYVF